MTLELFAMILLPSIFATPLLLGGLVLIDKLEGRQTKWRPRKYGNLRKT